MARIYLPIGLLLIALGAVLGWSIKPGPGHPTPAQTEIKQTQFKVMTKVTTTKPDGTVVVKEVEKRALTKSSASKASPPQYRVGVQTGLDLKPTVTAGRRLFGSLWIDSSFKPSTKDVTLGLSYEF